MQIPSRCMEEQKHIVDVFVFRHVMFLAFVFCCYTIMVYFVHLKYHPGQIKSHYSPSPMVLKIPPNNVFILHQFEGNANITFI